MINFTMDGKEVNGQEDWTILEVARWHGIDIPTLCFHEAVEPYGACRLCVVEVDDGQRSRVVISCMYPIREGIKVLTNTERVSNVRRWIMQLLVDENPGSEKLRNLAKAYGVTPSRFKAEGPGELCHLCGLCVRVCDEVVGVRGVTFANRGLRKEIASAFDEASKDCVGCGTCLYVCPTGAMDQLFDHIRG
jgi:bidirectional [NiFe] hydrogenase diaphorase subunit